MSRGVPLSNTQPLPVIKQHGPFSKTAHAESLVMSRVEKSQAEMVLLDQGGDLVKWTTPKRGKGLKKEMGNAQCKPRSLNESV